MDYTAKDLIHGQCLAHRGFFKKGVPENSAESIRLAVEHGLDIEIDVHRCMDGSFAVAHDFTLFRNCGIPWVLCCLSRKAFGKTRLLGSDKKECIPSLEEVLEIVDGKVTIFLEAKVLTSPKKYCRDLEKVLQNYKGKVLIHGLHLGVLRYFQSKGYPTALLCVKARKEKKGFKPEAINAKLSGLPVEDKENFPLIMGWTVRDNESLEKCAKVADCAVVDTQHFDVETLKKGIRNA